jgi:hypothetical protein
MRSMRLVSTIILVGTWLGGFSACSTVMMNTPVSKAADGWAITLAEVKDFPDEYVGEGGVLVAPGDDQKLIWALVTVKSNLTQDETFAWDTCVLTGKGEARPPSVVDRHAPEVNAAADRSEDFSPGQDRTRQLVYTYPKEQRPTSLRCGNVVLPIPAPKR